MRTFCSLTVLEIVKFRDSRKKKALTFDLSFAIQISETIYTTQYFARHVQDARRHLCRDRLGRGGQVRRRRRRRLFFMSVVAFFERGLIQTRDDEIACSPRHH